MVDDFNRELLAIEVDFNLPAARVVRTLEWIAALRGYPRKMRLDNGPEFISVTLADWAEQHSVLLEFIKPGKPMHLISSKVARVTRTSASQLHLLIYLLQVRLFYYQTRSFLTPVMFLTEPSPTCWLSRL